MDLGGIEVYSLQPTYHEKEEWVLDNIYCMALGQQSIFLLQSDMIITDKAIKIAKSLIREQIPKEDILNILKMMNMMTKDLYSIPKD